MLRAIGVDTVSFPRANRTSLLSDINSANVAAGMTAALFYVFGAIPVHLDSVSTLGLTPAAASSWFFITFMTSAISSLILSIKFRIPLPIGWSMPGLIFLATASGKYSHAEMMGACVLAGVAMVIMGFLGFSERLMRWMPLPIVMGMFAGSLLGYVTGIFRQLEVQPMVVGATILGYLGARAYGRVWCPPIAGAFISGVTLAAITGQVNPGSFRWSPPAIQLMTPELDPSSFLALTIPLLVMAIGIGNVQGLGILAAQGYRSPVKLLMVWMGVTTMINTAFGGHTSSLQNGGSAMLGGPDAGPRDQRYIASAVAAFLAVLLGLCAATAGTLLGILPFGLVPALAGLALLTAVMDAFKRTSLGELPMGAFFALIIATSGVSLLGIGAAFWALVGGIGVSLLLERPALRVVVRAK